MKKTVPVILLFFLIISCKQQNKEYLYGVPPAPPYKQIEVTVNSKIIGGCFSLDENLIGYIISFKENSMQQYEVIIQDTDGVKKKLLHRKRRNVKFRQKLVAKYTYSRK